MPLNPTTYLEGHGWQGKGVPLDGKEGRGLKKPLALPNKRNFKGLGKDRDRATEWWDCLFEASAKSINIHVGGDQKNGKSAMSPLDAVKAVQSMTPRSEATGTGVEVKTLPGKLSLVSQAKREYARKMLMNGFVRGHDSGIAAAEREVEKAIKEQERVKEEERVRKKASEGDKENEGKALREKEADARSVDERARSKEEKRQRRDEKKRRKEAEGEERGVRQRAASSKKRKRNEKHGTKKDGKEKRTKEEKRAKEEKRTKKVERKSAKGSSSDEAAEKSKRKAEKRKEVKGKGVKGEKNLAP